MGGERASTTRQRLAGRTCALCGIPLDAPPWGWHGERTCDRCHAAKPQRRILMNFLLFAGAWRVSFLEADCHTSLRRKLTFRNADKIGDMARRGRATLDSEGRCMLNYAIQQGRGSIWLNLTDTQYRALK